MQNEKKSGAAKETGTFSVLYPDESFAQLLYWVDPENKMTVRELLSTITPSIPLPDADYDKNRAEFVGAVMDGLRGRDDLKIHIKGEPEPRQLRVSDSGDVVISDLPNADRIPFNGFQNGLMRAVNSINKSFFEEQIEQQNDYIERSRMNAEFAARSPKTDPEGFREYLRGRKLESAMDFYRDRKNGAVTMCREFYGEVFAGVDADDRVIDGLCGLLGQPLESFSSDTKTALNLRRDLAERIFNGKPLSDGEIAAAQKIAEAGAEMDDPVEQAEWSARARFKALSAINDFITTSDRADNAFVNACTVYENLYSSTVAPASGKTGAEIVSRVIRPNAEELKRLRATDSLTGSICAGKNVEEMFRSASANDLDGMNAGKFEGAVAAAMLGKATQQIMHSKMKEISLAAELPIKAYSPNFFQKVYSSGVEVSEILDSVRKTDAFRHIVSMPRVQAAEHITSDDRTYRAAVIEATSEVTQNAAARLGVDLSKFGFGFAAAKRGQAEKSAAEKAAKEKPRTAVVFTEVTAPEA